MIIIIHKCKLDRNNENVIIHRPFPLGNPYTHKPLNNTMAEYKCENREEAIEKYKKWLLNKIEENDEHVMRALWRIKRLSEKGGRVFSLLLQASEMPWRHY